MRTLPILACLLIISGCCRSSARHEADCKIPKVTARDITIGQEVVLTGVFGRSMLGPCIVSTNGVIIRIHYVDESPKDWTDIDAQMVGKTVSVKGTLHYVEYSDYRDWNNLSWGQHPESHLYFDARTATIY
jgi:hypothetical protein